MTGNEKFRLKVVDDLRKNRVIVESDEEYIVLLKKANKDLGDLVRERDEQLAASQAQIKVLRDALYDQLNDCINFNGGKLTTCIMEQSTKVLEQPADDSALRELLKAERERCAKVIERLISGDGICADDGVWIHDCAEAIRAMGDQ